MTASGNVSEHSTGTAVDIAAINGINIYGHQGPGSITDLTIQRLLTLQGTMKPHQIISLMTFKGADNTLAMGDHADHIHVGWRPLYGENKEAAKQIDAILKPKQWIKLIDRLGEIDNPTVAEQPSKYAVKVKRADRLRSARHVHRGHQGADRAGRSPNFQREVPALEKLKLVFELELRGRGDIQLFRVEVPGPKITRDIASDAKVRLSIPRTEFNELAKDGTIRHWRECFESGHVKASGPPEILKLIANVVLKQEERTRTRRLQTRSGGSGVQRDPGHHLAHDPVRDQRGDVGRADLRRRDLDHVHPAQLDPRADLAAGPQQVDRRHPARLRRAGAGRERRVEHVDVHAQEHRAVADDRRARATTTVADAELAHVVHEQARDAALALPGELGLPRPVAAQADLDVARRVDVALLDEPVHDRAVRELGAEHLSPVSVCVSKWISPTGPRRRAIARMSGSAIEWSPPRITGSAPASTTWPTSASIASCVRTGSAGSTAASPKSTTRSTSKRVDARLQVRAGRAATRRGSRAGRSGCPGRSRHEIVGRRADDRHVDAGELRGVLRVGHAARRSAARRSPASHRTRASARADRSSARTITGYARFRGSTYTSSICQSRRAAA